MNNTNVLEIVNKVKSFYGINITPGEEDRLGRVIQRECNRKPYSSRHRVLPMNVVSSMTSRQLKREIKARRKIATRVNREAEKRWGWTAKGGRSYHKGTFVLREPHPEELKGWIKGAERRIRGAKQLLLECERIREGRF